MSMSIEKWIEHAYPETARSAAARGPEAALDHSLRKWQALRPGVLERFGVRAFEFSLFDASGSEFLVDASTCALCVLTRMECAHCPLFAAGGGEECAGNHQNTRRPYNRFTRGGDPEPMINLLLRAKCAGESR